MAAGHFSSDDYTRRWFLDLSVSQATLTYASHTTCSHSVNVFTPHAATWLPGDSCGPYNQHIAR